MISLKLTKAKKERKNAEAALAGAKKQAEEQRRNLQKAEGQLAVAREQIEAQHKEFEGRLLPRPSKPGMTWVSTRQKRL